MSEIYYSSASVEFFKLPYWSTLDRPNPGASKKRIVPLESFCCNTLNEHLFFLSTGYNLLVSWNKNKLLLDLISFMGIDSAWKKRQNYGGNCGRCVDRMP